MSDRAETDEALRAALRRSAKVVAKGVPVSDRAETIADIIRNDLLGVEPDDQCVVLEDDDWRVILAAFDALRASEERAEKAEAERDEMAVMAAAHELKWQTLCKRTTGTCACSYDRPDDVCSLHSPKLTAAEARVKELEAALLEIVAITEDGGTPIYVLLQKANWSAHAALTPAPSPDRQP